MWIWLRGSSLSRPTPSLRIETGIPNSCKFPTFGRFPLQRSKGVCSGRVRVKARFRT
ncbi:hypothetical protein M378DRAFT_998147 [Amanita muscaria Koide BX008]|uniref:Uncharacterized protein n=1 Tax=Amanita muscaria (strain Koide BX008) TaxID=946122 RepID=A0A0C2RUK8_AMAMK|nr:hypothetical protein M378DRAFT_998147 [Amanita muscaria Koide BX008]